MIGPIFATAPLSTISTNQKQRVLGGSLESNGAISAALDAAIKTSASVEMAVLHLIDQYEINWQDLKRHLEAWGLDISFSQVTWNQVSRLVGITPAYELARIPAFQLQRARIPGRLFKSIVEDISHNNIVYGALREHYSVEAHSRFISPVFIRIVELFRSSITATPETLFQSRTTSPGRVVHQFCTVSGLSLLLLVEIKYKIGNPTKRQNVVAQIIAEADACDYRNQSQNHYYPVYCALFDGESFTFFKYDHSLDPKFWQSQLDLSNEFMLADSRKAPRQFIKDLRPICEIIFALLFTAHAQALCSQAETDSEEAKPA
ncbi:hypothetical protein FRB94_014066 [Tulasnella sp. JGI-2019a]|nr:hypothetical protein FRB94_014066 [Tulasnella sp. JGI-2019a]